MPGEFSPYISDENIYKKKGSNRNACNPLENFTFSIKQVYSQICFVKFLTVFQKSVLHKIRSYKEILVTLSERVARFHTDFFLQHLQLVGLHCTEVLNFLCSSDTFLEPGTKYFLLN